jgi:hypothetical protein
VTHTISFPTRIYHSKGSAIDNFFIVNTRLHSFFVSPIVNGLSDHDAQYLILKKVFSQNKSSGFPRKTRLMCLNSVSNFQEILKNETWVNIYEHDDVNDTFNSLLNTFLLIFEHCFPVQYPISKSKSNNKEWITKDIRVSCRRKRSLYILSRSCHNEKLKAYYTRYCVILWKLIREAKKMYCSRILIL